MKKIRMLTTAAAAVVVVVGIVPAISGNLVANFVIFDISDSPVSVGDGSIYGTLDVLSFNFWKERKKEKLHQASSTNSDYIQLQGFSDSATPASSPIVLQGTGGWLMVIFDKNSDGSPGPEEIRLCPNNAGSTSSCAAPSSGDGKTVSLEAEDKARWRAPWYFANKKVVFLDNRDGCDKDDDEGPCDHISKVTITTVNDSSGLPGPKGKTYDCTVPGCSITVGDKKSLLP